jgi:hydrogenase nickel incorporation protein HypA/HybF
MHEYSLVEALMRRVEEEARRRSALAVHGVSVRIGELAGVDPELFRVAYDTFRQGTLCEHAPLALRQVPATWSCPRCHRPVPRGGPLACAGCKEPARLDDGGDALTLDGIDLEVP